MTINGVGSTYTYWHPRSGGTGKVDPIKSITPLSNDGHTSQVLSSSKINPSECETCKNREYVDVSHDANVSFKTPGKISAKASYGKVLSHEMEHVAHAKSEDAKEGTTLLSSSVTLQYSICPECGSSYVAGGNTRTQIAYDESNPYERERKAYEGSFLIGSTIDYVA